MFGLKNAPSAFQSFMDSIFQEFYDQGVIILLDDITIHTRNDYDEHLALVKKVLKLLADNNLYAKVSKCEFFKKSILFLGHEISENGTSMMKDKVKAVLDWPVPKNVKHIQQFLGLANYYRRFIEDFLKFRCL